MLVVIQESLYGTTVLSLSVPFPMLGSMCDSTLNFHMILFVVIKTLRVSSLDTPSFDTPGPTFSIEVQVRLWYHNGQKQDKEYRVSKDDIGKYDMWLVRYASFFLFMNNLNISSCS